MMKTGRLLLLDNRVQHYRWGSPTAIPAIVGADNAQGEPWAELWMGAHPAAPSAAISAGATVRLPELFADRPEATLGAGVVARFGRELPFLLKVLAAAEPLSIQCHPDRAQAAEGYAREEAARVPLEAPARSYRDRNHKPELLVAESRFSALAGFRSPEEIAARLQGAGVDELATELRALRRTGDLRAFFAALMGLDDARKERALAQARRGVRGVPSPEAARVAELLVRHPGDVGALAPLYLNLVELAPGEGLFLPARQLHAYLEGVGIEVMASSDNVLRGGLTSKHVDVAELLAVLDFEPMRPAIVRAEPRGDVSIYRTPADEFELVHIEVGEHAPRALEGRGSVAIAFCIEGAVHLVDVTTGESLALGQGRAALLAGEVERVHIEGRGRLYAARVPI